MIRNLFDRLMNAPHWIFRVTFFVVVFLFLFVGYDDVLYRIFWNGYFATNDEYLHEVVFHTGGALCYLSQFLNQVMYYPALGAALVSGLLTVIAYLNERCFRLSGSFFACTFLAPLILLSLYTGIGYDIYMRIDTSFGLSSILGCLTTLSLYLLYVTSDRLRWGQIIVVIVTALLYPAIGFYGLSALLLMTVNACLSRKNVLCMVGVMIAAFVLLPLLFDVWMFGDGYDCGVSSLLLSSSYFKLRTFQILALASLVFLPAARVGDDAFVKRSVFQMLSLAVCAGLCYLLSYHDDTFYSELRVSRLSDKCDWNGVLSECKNHKDLSKTLNAYRVVALTNTHKLSNSLFKINLPFKETPFSPYENYLYEDVLYFQAGFLSSTTRVTIESWQRFGLSYRRLRYLTLCALMCDEERLALKYMNLLKQSFSMAGELEKMEKMRNNMNAFLKEYPEYITVLQRKPEENVLFRGSASISRCFLCFSSLPKEDYEMRLMSDMWERNINAFCMDLNAYVSEYTNSIPECVKEAAAIAVLSGASQSLISMAQVDEEILNKVKYFFSSLKSYGDDGKERALRDLKSSYGKTYCYYYAFGNIK